MIKKILLVLIFVLFVFPKAAFAHDASLTYTTIHITDKDIDLVLTTPQNNILQLSSDPQADPATIDPKFFTKQFSEGFIVTNNDQPCKPKLKQVERKTDIKSYRYHFIYTCPQPLENINFIYNLFFALSPTHENIADIHTQAHTTQVIFSSTNHTVSINYGQEQSDSQFLEHLRSVITFLKIGILHILTGYDHILFLLGLLLVTTKIKSLLKVITAFTLAHSITLSIATLGIFLFPARLTESLIALSIIIVAIEDLFLMKSASPTTKYRWLMVFAFGLIHGFGFSSALREVGLPQKEIIPALISFNVGVEIGQLLIISCLYPLIIFIRKKLWGQKSLFVMTMLIGMLGFVWFVQRAFNL